MGCSVSSWCEALIIASGAPAAPFPKVAALPKAMPKTAASQSSKLGLPWSKNSVWLIFLIFYYSKIDWGSV
jgi:hypothetical protein